MKGQQVLVDAARSADAWCLKTDEDRLKCVKRDCILRFRHARDYWPYASIAMVLVVGPSCSMVPSY